MKSILLGSDGYQVLKMLSLNYKKVFEAYVKILTFCLFFFGKALPHLFYL